jgi:hypothetical protein
VGLYFLEKIPVVDVAVKVTEDAIVDRAQQWGRYLGSRFGGQPELIDLLLDPVERLSRTFFADLGQIADKHRLLLAFDNFEFTRAMLDSWLGQLGNFNPSPRVYYAIGSRTPPGQDAPWDDLAEYVLHVALDFFTDQEANDFLDQRQILDAQRREEILRLSSKLPE